MARATGDVGTTAKTANALLRMLRCGRAVPRRVRHPPMSSTATWPSPTISSTRTWRRSAAVVSSWTSCAAPTSSSRRWVRRRARGPPAADPRRSGASCGHGALRERRIHHRERRARSRHDRDGASALGRTRASRPPRAGFIHAAPVQVVSGPRLEIGTPCEALYKADGAWYGATVMSYTSSGGYVVLFNDYGNEVAPGARWRSRVSRCGAGRGGCSSCVTRDFAQETVDASMVRPMEDDDAAKCVTLRAAVTARFHIRTARPPARAQSCREASRGAGHHRWPKPAGQGGKGRALAPAPCSRTRGARGGGLCVSFAEGRQEEEGFLLAGGRKAAREDQAEGARRARTTGGASCVPQETGASAQPAQPVLSSRG